MECQLRRFRGVRTTCRRSLNKIHDRDSKQSHLSPSTSTEEYRRTWLVAVMHGDNCLTAEFISGSRNYIPRLIEICHILVSNTASLEGYEVILARDDWRNTLMGEDIQKFAGAWAVMP